jgi:hypothetical protein
VAGAWATGLVVVLGIPDGIRGTHLEGFLIGLAVPSARPVSCRQQYEAWKRRPALAEGTMQAAVNAVQVAEKSGNAAAVRSALKRLIPAALAAAQFPPPRCVDPDGLYGDYVSTVYEAGYNALSAQGISNLVKAAAPLKGLKTIDSQLAAEANRAMAKNL